MLGAGCPPLRGCGGGCCGDSVGSSGDKVSVDKDEAEEEEREESTGLCEGLLIPGRGSLGRTGGGWVGAKTALGETDMASGAVTTRASTMVEVAADLLG